MLLFYLLCKQRTCPLSTRSRVQHIPSEGKVCHRALMAQGERGSHPPRGIRVCICPRGRITTSPNEIGSPLQTCICPKLSSAVANTSQFQGHCGETPLQRHPRDCPPEEDCPEAGPFRQGAPSLLRNHCVTSMCGTGSTSLPTPSTPGPC